MRVDAVARVPLVHAVEQRIRLFVARAEEVDLELVDGDLAAALFLEAPGEADVVRVGVRDEELRELGDRGADLLQLVRRRAVCASSVDQPQSTRSCSPRLVTR